MAYYWATATEDRRCAYCGKPIRRGDRVYRNLDIFCSERCARERFIRDPRSDESRIRDILRRAGFSS